MTAPAERQRERRVSDGWSLAGRGILAGLALAGLAIGASITPGRESISVSGYEIASPCAFRFVTGLPCPGCGLTRSVAYTLHGDLPSAVALHAFGPVAALAAALFALWQLWRLVELASGRPAMRLPLSAQALGYLLASCGVLLAAHWAYRLAVAMHET